MTVADINKAMKLANSAPEISVASILKPSESSTGQSIWEFHDNLIANNMQSNSDPLELHLELLQYFNQPVIPRQANPIEYWQCKKRVSDIMF